jgi:hypothetical protein
MDGGSGDFKSSANFSSPANFSAPRGRGRGRGGQAPRGRNGGRGQGRGGRPPSYNNNKGRHNTATTTPTTATAADKATTAPRSLAKFVASLAMEHVNAGTATPRKSKKNTTLHTPPPTASTQTGTWTVEPLTTSQASWTR